MATSHTSITVNKFTKFKQDAAERSQLGCNKISGFFLIKLRKGVSWRLRYTDISGRRRTATIANGETKPEQAALIALNWHQKLKDGIDPIGHKKALKAAEEQNKQTTEAAKYLVVRDYFKHIYTPYQEAYRRNARYTLNTIKNNFKHLFDRNMDKLTPADVKAWYNQRREEGIARSTLQRDYGAFKAMLNHAATPVDEAPPVLALNPLSRVGLPKMTLAEKDLERQKNQERSASRDLFSDDDKKSIELGLNKLAEKIRGQRRRSRKHGKAYLADLDQVTFPHWFIPFTYIAWLTGMRTGDVRTLKWENLEHNRFNGKSSIVFTPAKTQDKGDNPIRVKFPVAGKLAEVLQQWKEQNGNPQTGWVFPSERIDGSMNKKSHRKPWLEVKKLGGVRDDMDFYSFRHNFISELVAKGVPVLTIAGLVGHRDGTMIAQNYLRHNEQDSADVVAELGASLGQVTEEKQEMEA